MKLTQISILISNEPNALVRICEILKNNNVDITTLTLADSTDYGILRLIIRDWEVAKAALEKENLIVKTTDVIAISVPNQVGGLFSILDCLGKAGINIEYMYGFSSAADDNCVQVLRLDDTDRGIEVLEKANIGVLKKAELFKKA